MDPNPYATPMAPAATPAPKKLGRLGKILFAFAGLAIGSGYVYFALQFRNIIVDLGIPRAPALDFPLSGGFVVAILPALSPTLAPLIFRRLTRRGEIATHIVLLIAAIVTFGFLFAGWVKEVPILIQDMSHNH